MRPGAAASGRAGRDVRRVTGARGLGPAVAQQLQPPHEQPVEGVCPDHHLLWTGELDRRRRYYRDGATAVVMERPLTGPATNVWTTS